MEERTFLKLAEAAFVEHLKSRGLEDATIRRKMQEFKRFMVYTSEKNETDLRNVSDRHL
jgi:hypothetical protein